MSLRKNRRGCIEHACHHYVSLRMQDAQSGKTIDEFMCDDLARLKVAFDTGKLTTEVGASIDSLRNISHTNLSQRLSGVSNYFDNSPAFYRIKLIKSED